MSFWTQLEEKSRAEGRARLLLDLIARGLLPAETALREFDRLVRDGEIPEGSAAEFRPRLVAAR